MPKKFFPEKKKNRPQDARHYKDDADDAADRDEKRA